MFHVALCCLVVTADPYLPGYGFSESALPMDPGHWLLDAGWTYSEEGGDRCHSLGEWVVYAGLGRRTEIRFGLPA